VSARPGLFVERCGVEFGGDAVDRASTVRHSAISSSLTEPDLIAELGLDRLASSRSAVVGVEVVAGGRRA
jgi:hypothetical protein